jgi:ATP-dependent protease HslVU (ClpYQ) peptidase subunit
VTTLAAFQGNGFAIIGADSRATDDDGSHIVLSNPKVMWDDHEDYLFATTGATRGGNLVQQGWVPPEPPPFTTIHKLDQFITQVFIEQLREHFVESGFESKARDSAAWTDSAFLIAVHGVIYPINSDYGWDRDRRGIYVFGSGGDVSLGVMHALGIDKCKDDPKKALAIVKKAVEAACEWNAYCALPVVIETQYVK